MDIAAAIAAMEGTVLVMGVLIGALVALATVKYMLWRWGGICFPGMPCK